MASSHAQEGDNEQMPGIVYLVGAGPGDPDLITVRGRALLERAEAVVYDYLSNPTLLSYCAKSCERIYVGKQGGDHTMTQEEINSLLVSLAAGGKSVVRLKGGDPYVFGRGGEEALELARNGIAFEVVPGITSGVAAPAYAGIPLTHRGLATSALLVTGHEAAGKTESDIDWSGIARSDATLVFYMGVKNLSLIADKLIANGKPPGTPTALIRWGTDPRQQTLASPLEEIASIAESANFKAPSIFIVGGVVSLRDELRWFDTRLLFGRRIVVTRSRTSRSSLVDKLRAAGADVVEFPTITVAPKEDGKTTAMRMLSDRRRRGWLIFTSQNAVAYFFAALQENGKDSRDIGGMKTACVGKETASALSTFGVNADVVPERQTSDDLLASFDSLGIRFTGTPVLFPCADIAKNTIPDGLGKRGALVDRIPVYETLQPDYTADEIESIFDPPPDLITFTSSSTVENLVSVLREAHKESVLDVITGAAIGPSTAATVAAYKIRLGCESTEPGIDGLIKSIIIYFGETN